MTDPREASEAIHALAASEVWYVSALNMGRGTKRSERVMESNRVKLFELIVGRPPNDDEREFLLRGDA